MKKLLLLFTMVLVTSMGLLAQGSTWQTATLISSGQTKTGAMGTNNSEDWYKINVTQEGTVDITGIVTSGDLLLNKGSSFNGFKLCKLHISFMILDTLSSVGAVSTLPA